MKTFQRVRCPNCGSYAERHHLSSEQLIRTQCSTCDYLMITCAATGKVIEAYAPGLYPSFIKFLGSETEVLDTKKLQTLPSAVKFGSDQAVQSLTSKHRSYAAPPRKGTS